MIPDPLPLTLPIGTTVTIGSCKYQTMEIVEYDSGNKKYLAFTLRDITLNKILHAGLTPYHLNPTYISWDEINNIVDSNKVTKPSNQCAWCSRQLEFVGKFCDAKHESYFTHLKERMDLSFINISEVLDYDKSSVVKYVNNKMNWKEKV